MSFLRVRADTSRGSGSYALGWLPAPGRREATVVQGCGIVSAEDEEDRPSPHCTQETRVNLLEKRRRWHPREPEKTKIIFGAQKDMEGHFRRQGLINGMEAQPYGSGTRGGGRYLPPEISGSASLGVSVCEVSFLGTAGLLLGG